MNTTDLLSIIKDCAFEVRKELAPGYLESIYNKALAIELRSHGLNIEEESPIRVNYKGYHVGDFRADIIVEGKVIIELKAISELNKSHHIQLVNYLTATRIDDGFLINYGAEDYRIIHKTRLFDRSYRSKNQVQE